MNKFINLLQNQEVVVMKEKESLAERTLAPNPQETASILSRWCFHYLQPIFRLGAAGSIQERQVPMPIESNRSNVSAPRLERSWENERTKKAPSLLRALVMANWRLIPKIFTLSLIGFGARNIMPFFLSELIDWFADERQDTARAYGLAGMTFKWFLLFVIFVVY